MRKTAIEMMVSIAAGAVTYAVFEYAKPFDLGWRLAGAAAITILCFGIAAWMRRDPAPEASSGTSGTTIGEDIDASTSITVRSVSVEGAQGPVAVANRLRSGGPVEISDIEVTGHHDDRPER